MCMMRSDAINLDNYPVRTEISVAKHILISQVCYTGDSKSREFQVDENLSQVCSSDKDESKSIINNESYREESESEYVHKSVNI